MIINNLDNIMKEKKISINKLYLTTGISRLYLAKLCNNKSKAIRFENLEKICKALNCNIGELLAIT